MNKILEIAALVGAIFLPVFVMAGTIISEIGLCKHNLWFAAIVFVALFVLAANKVVELTVKLWEFWKNGKDQD